MKASLLTTAALAGLLALSGCAAAPSDSAGTPTEGSSTPAAVAGAGAAEAPSASAPSPGSAGAAAQSTTQGTDSTAGKVHFTGDYTQTTEADSAKILELNKQWISPEKEAELKAKLDSAGLSSNIPGEIAADWYSSRAGSYCQAYFDGHNLNPEGVWIEVGNAVRSVYCPELG
ncbi:hypothetical protein FBY31_3553 [Arthrobacter sp. SLBN-100]|uniref:hypothetical protein n=1 Tax=Arthrobacter sp. SLBN-100 TaxID=2768450 RepID=UPI00114ECDC0|nr:hypothetical protein [Arthrobacter sp. SLBN-100]TQJ69410.1 hypothetical protein FBY31_3553 [Arthrobacter sp. SLBN-100]